MKRITVPLFLAVFAFGYSQQQKYFSFQSAQLSLTTDFKPLNTQFASFSKNYEKVFGEYNFTFDSNNFGDRNVYVGHDDRMYYQGRSTFIMDYPGPHTTNYSWNADYISGLVSGVKLIFNQEKDYTKSYSSFKQ